MSEFLRKHGMGEAYRIRAQMLLIDSLKKDLRLETVCEFPPEPVSLEYPEQLNWMPTEDPGCAADLLFTWRSFRERVMRMRREFPGRYLMFMGTNLLNPGVIFQKLYWKEREHYARIRDLEALCQRLRLKTVRKGFYDCPFWLDAPLPYGVHLPFSRPGNWGILEHMPGKVIRAHHVYVVGEKPGFH